MDINASIGMQRPHDDVPVCGVHGLERVSPVGERLKDWLSQNGLCAISTHFVRRLAAMVSAPGSTLETTTCAKTTTFCLEVFPKDSEELPEFFPAGGFRSPHGEGCFSGSCEAPSEGRRPTGGGGPSEGL